MTQLQTKLSTSGNMKLTVAYECENNSIKEESAAWQVVRSHASLPSSPPGDMETLDDALWDGGGVLGGGGWLGLAV